VDFQRDGLGEFDLLHAAHGLRLAGCTRWLLTLISDEWPRLMRRLHHLREVRAHSPELQRAIAGWHIEGPFLSSQAGFRGAHDPTVMCDPRPRHIEELRAATGQDPVLLTLDPARPGALEAIELAVTRGMRVNLGHTDAPAALLRAAVQAGASGFTHLGNGCPRQLDRFDNILWRVLETPGLAISLIPDAAHVSGALFRFVHRLVDRHRLYYVSDAMAAADAPRGRYSLGRLELEVGPDQIVRLPGTDNLAGSSLRPVEGVFRAASMLGCSWREVWPQLSDVPAGYMQWPLGLAVGQPADFCILHVMPPNQLLLHHTYAGGVRQSV
jgi:N-acetylglucosamine-6-phosphate deacetylase